MTNSQNIVRVCKISRKPRGATTLMVRVLFRWVYMIDLLIDLVGLNAEHIM